MAGSNVVVFQMINLPNPDSPSNLASHVQAEALTMPVVVSRLINARRHWLALQISSLLGLGPEKVRAHAYLRRYTEGLMEGNALQRCMQGMW